MADGPLARNAIVRKLGHKSLSGAIRKAIHRLLHDGSITYTMPGKPNSRLQQYMLSPLGKTALKVQTGIAL